MPWLWNSPTARKSMAPIEEHKSLHWAGALPLTAGNENWRSLVSCALQSECCQRSPTGPRTRSPGSDPGVPRAVGSCRFWTCTWKLWGFLWLDQRNSWGVSYVLTDCKTRRPVCINESRTSLPERRGGAVRNRLAPSSRPPGGGVSRLTRRALVWRVERRLPASRARAATRPLLAAAGRAAGAWGGSGMAGGPQENTLLHLFAGGWVRRAAPEGSSVAVRTEAGSAPRSRCALRACGRGAAVGCC